MTAMESDKSLLTDAARTRMRSVLIGATLAVVALTLPLPEEARHDATAAGLVIVLALAGWLLSWLPPLRRASRWLGPPASLLAVTALVLSTGGLDSPYDALFGMHVFYGVLFFTTRWLVLHLIAVSLCLLGVALVTAMQASHIGTAAAELTTTLALWAGVGIPLRMLLREATARRAERDAQEQRYRSLFEHNPTAIYTLDRDRRIVAANHAMEQLSQYAAADLVGSNFDDVFTDVAAGEFSAEFAAALNSQATTSDSVLVDATGKSKQVRLTKLPVVVDGTVEGVHVVALDVSELTALHTELRRQALYDPLTGLANRRLFNDRLDQALRRGKRDQRPISALLLDLDGFKSVNDTLGHAAGDELLKEVSLRLTHCLRPGDTLARLGGDEFACLLPDTDHAGAQHVAERMVQTLTNSFRTRSHDISIGVSIGIAATDTGSATDADQLIGQADAAMYSAKNAGGSRTHGPDDETSGGPHPYPMVSTPAATAAASTCLMKNCAGS